MYIATTLVHSSPAYNYQPSLQLLLESTLCITAVVMAFRTLFNPPLTPFDPTHRYFTSWLISPFALSLLRGIIALYVFVTLIYTLAYSSVNNPQRVGRHWSYFTNITNWSEAFYFLFAAGHGAWYARNGRVPLEQWWKLLRFAHGLLYTTVLTFPILV